MRQYLFNLAPTPFSQSIANIPVIGDFFHWITAKPTFFTFNRPFNKRAVIVFYFWLRQQYTDPVAFYRICEDLDIHRCVLQEWFNALDNFNLLKPIVYKSNVYYLFEPLTGKVGPARPLVTVNKNIRIIPCSDFDPTTNRNYDKIFSNFMYPEDLCGTFKKYYSVYVNEKLRYEGVTQELPTIDKDFPHGFTKEYYKEKYQNPAKPFCLRRKQTKQV